MSAATLDEEIRSHLETLEAAPGDAQAFAALEALYQKHDRWEDLVSLYEGRARLVPDPGVAPGLLARAAEVAQLRLKNTARAEQLYRQLLQADPRHEAALHSIVEITEERGDQAALAEALERQANGTADPRAAAAIYLRLGRIVEEKLSRLDRAALFYTRASRLDPALAEARRRAVECCLALRRPSQAKRLLDAAREGGAEPLALAGEYTQLGALLVDEPLEHDLAMEALLDALALDPSAAGAAVVLAELKAMPSAWREHAKALAAEASRSRDRRDTAERLLRIAQLHAAYDPEAGSAVQEYVERAWAQSPGMAPALELLERYHTERQDWRGLSDALVRLAASTRDRAALVAVQLRLAQVDLVRFGDSALALAALERALELDPACEPAALQAFELHADAGRSSEALALLERHLAAAESKPGHAPLRLRAAEMALSRLGDPARARRHLEAALRADRGFAPAAAALAPLYAQSREFRKLVDVLEQSVAAERDPAEQVRVLEQIAEIHEQKLGDTREALRVLARALQLDPRRAATRKAMEGAAARAGDFLALARAYRAAADAPGNDLKSRKVLLRRTAEIFDRDLGMAEEAVAAYRALVAIDADDRGAAGALASCLARAGQHAELAASLAERMAAASGPERRELAAQLARLHQEASEPGSAAEAWRECLTADQDDLEALSGLAAALEALEGTGPAEELLEVLSRLSPRRSGPERADLELRRAALLERLGRPAEAVDAYLAALGAGPLSSAPVSRAIAELERLLARGVEPVRIAQGLAPVHAARREPARQATMLELLARRVNIDARERARLFLDVAALREEHLGDGRAAFGAALAALRACPSHTEARQLCERLASELGTFAELYAALDETAGALAGQPEDERALRLRAAQIAEQDLGSGDAAEAQLRRCIALSPGDPDTLAALTRVAMAGERWADACDVVVERAGRAAGPERTALFTQLAEIRLERLADAAGAADAYRQALESAPAEQRSRLLARRAAALDRAGDPAGQARALEELAACAVDPAEAVQAILEHAQVQAERLGDPCAAVANLQAALARSPGDPRVIAALEALLAGSDRGATVAAARVLAPIHESARDARKLLRALEVVAESASEVAERAAAYRRIAEVYDVDLGQASLAFAALSRAVRLIPGDAGLRAELRRLAQESHAGEACARVHEDLAAALPEREALAVLRELAEFCERVLGDRDRAVAAHERVLALAPGDPAALEALRRLHRAADRWPELHAVCVDLAGRVGDAAARVALWREAAAVAEGRLQDLARAAEAWERVAEIDSGDAEADAALERLYERLDRPDALAGTLERRRVRRGQRDLALEFRIAEIHRTRLGAAEAVPLHAAILRADPRHRGALDALLALAGSPGPEGGEALLAVDPLLAAAGEHARRVEAREARLGAAREAEERTRLYREIRSILEHDLAQPQMAFVAACRAFAEGGPARGDALADLARLAEETDSLEALAEVYDEAALSAPPDEALSFRRDAARIRERAGGDVAGAIGGWKRVLEAATDDVEALDALERLYTSERSARELADVLRRRVALASGAGKVKHLLQLGATLADGLGDAAAAASAYEEALALEPRNAEALEMVERLYARERRTEDLARILAARAEMLCGDPPRRVEILLRRAALLEETAEVRRPIEAYAEVLAEKPQEAGAVAGLERLLNRPDSREAAARLLEDVYRMAGDARRLVNLLELRLEGADGAERPPLLAEIAALHERLNQKPQAFLAKLRQYRETLRGGDDDPGVRAELDRLASETGAFEDLAAAFEDALEQGVQGEARVELMRRLAALFADRLSRLDDAARWYEEIAAVVPGAEVFGALARIYRRQNAFRELAGVYERQVAVASAAEAKKDLLFEVATIMEEHLSDRDGAIQAYRNILSIDPEDPNALRLLTRLLGAAERWEELCDALGREVGIADRRPNFVAEAADLRFRLGRIRQQRLADAAGALQCYRGVLEKVPRHPAALAALEELARTAGPVAAEAAALLEPIYLQEGEHGKLVETLEARLALLPDPPARSALLRRIAEIYLGTLKNTEMAFLSIVRAMREDPEGLEPLDIAVQLAETGGFEDEFGALLDENAERARDPGARAEYRRRHARLLARRGDPQRAADAWQRLLDLVPDDPEALAGLTHVQRASGSGEGLAQVLRRRIAVEEDPGQRVALLAELAQVQEERLKDAAGAIGTLRRVLEIEPHHRDALVRVDRLCVRGEKWVELADVLGREIAAADEAQDSEGGLAFRYRLAELRESRLLDREGALSLYEQILTARPDHSETVGRLEAMLQRDPGNARAADVLQRAFAAGGAWSKHAALIELRAGERPDPLERKALLLELADVRETQLANPELAFLAVCRAFREDPADAAVRQRLERLAEGTEHQEELAAIYEDEFERLDSGAALEVAVRLGGIYEERLQSPERAVEFYERARRLDPASRPALVALDRLHRRFERWPDLADVLEAEADLEAGRDERIQLLFRLGQLCEERLQAPDRAARAYETILIADPRHGPALRALERLYESAGRTEALLANLAAQREVAADVVSRERLASKMAAIAGASGRDAEAVALWREVLTIKPRHEQALVELERLYDKLEQWPELAELLRTRLTATVDRREVTRLNDRLGWLMGTKLGNAAQAVASFRAVLESDPRNRRALEALRDIYAAQGNVDELGSVYRRLIPLQEDAAGVKEVRLKLAELLVGAGHKADAIDHAKRAFDLEPHTAEDLLRFEEILGAAGAAAERIRATEARAALLASQGRTPEALAAWFAAADLWQQLGRAEGAAAALENALELEPSSRDAYEGLRRIYAEAGNWRAYTRVCDLFAQQISDHAERLALLEEVAEIHEKRLGQKEMSFLSWCRAFQEAPSDPAAADAVQRLAAETEAFDELAAVYEQVAEEAKGPLRARLLLQLGRIRDQRLDDIEGAEAAFRKALDVEPASPEALDALTELFTRRGAVRDLVITLEQKLEAAAGLDEKKATLLEVAKIYDGQLQDVEEAVGALKRVLELDGADAAAIDALAAIYRREKRWEDLASVLARARDLAGDETTRIAYQLQVSALYENEIGDDEAAVEAYRVVLGMDDRQIEALAGLERLYTKLDRFAELNRIYERQADLATDAREQIRILSKSAGIWDEKLHNTQKAIERNEQILSLDGGNVSAVKSLERLYRQEGLWEKLISVTEHHVTLTQDRREIVALEVAIGETWWKELARVDRAEAIFNHALQIDSESRQAVSALGRLYERSGNWNLALEMLKREARLAAASPDAVEIQFRVGRILEEMLLDVTAAKEAYGRALELDPGHLPAIRAMKGIYERERDRDAYLESLVAEAKYTDDDAEKSRLLTELGKLYQEERDDRESAARAYEEALKRTPDHLPAARPLSDIYVGDGAWEKAETVLDIVVARLAAEGETKELCRQSYRLGYVAEKLGKRDKALECHRRAYELDSTYLPALEGLGNLLVQEESWDEALRIYQAILIHHRDGLTDLEVVEIYWQIGEIQSRLGQLERAAKNFEKALEIDAGHEPSRRSLVRVLETMGDFEAVVDHRQKLLPILDGKAKFEMLVAIGEACRDKLDDPYQAIDAFLGASRIDPTSLAATEALLGLYRQTRQGQKAADVLERLLALTEVQADADRAAKLHLSLGEILRDEIKEEEAAIAEFEKALDRNPRLVQAFSAVEALLTQAKNWPALEQAYLRMIQRLPKGAEVAQARLALWRTLAELYRRVLDSADGARMAYGVVVKADPEDTAALEIYADLCAAKPGEEAEAIAAYRRLLEAGGAQQKALSAMIALHAARKAYDEAYSAVQVLAHLTGGASAEEIQVLARLRRFTREAASRSLDDRLWLEHLAHPKARGPLAEIMTLLVSQAGALFTQTPKDLGLNAKKDELDVQGSMLFFVNMYKYVARTLGIAPLRLFRVAGSPGRLALVPTDPPGIVAGEDMFRERPKKELWFAIAKAMAFARPELRMARLMPHDQLEVVFQAACSLGTSRFVVTADPHLVEKLKRQLEKALPEQTRLQTLKKLARQYCDVQHAGDVRAYMDAAELTSNRVGALLAGDLEIVKRAVLTQKPQVSKLRDETRIRDLVLFCASQEYALLRDRLGMSVIVSGQGA